MAQRQTARDTAADEVRAALEDVGAGCPDSGTDEIKNGNISSWENARLRLIERHLSSVMAICAARANVV